MSGKYLIDTNIIIGIINKDENVINKINRLENIFISSISIGELYYGAFNSNSKKENIDVINDIVDKNEILSCDKLTSMYYGEIKFKLKKKGKPIPENDIWISAISLQYNLILITMDKHFTEVETINKEIW